MAVRRVQGVQSVEGNAKERTITAHFDPQVAGEADIEKAMARIGYKAESRYPGDKREG
jgi:copper chaperone CopZ